MNVPAQTIKVNNVTLLNGQLSDELLISVGGREKLYQPAAESFLKMMEEAKKIGLKYILEDTYRLCGEPGDGKRYRNGEIELTQWAAWENYQAYKQGKISKPYNLASDPTNGCKSKHGYGLAIDIYNNPKVTINNFYRGVKAKTASGDVIYENGKPLYIVPPQQDELQTWIKNNGKFYGWIWTGANFPSIEPWHFDYFYEKDQTRNSYSAPLITKTPKQINDSTTQDQNKYAVNKNVTKSITNFFS